MLFIRPGDRERLTVLQLDFGLGPPCRDRRHAEALEHDRVAEVERADLGPTFSLIRSPPSTVGVKLSRTPYSLN